MSFRTRVYMNPDVENVRGENTLAVWDARWPQWVDDLLEAGKLTQSRSDNFPSLYRGAGQRHSADATPRQGDVPGAHLQARSALGTNQRLPA